jgi:hypothetical protein
MAVPGTSYQGCLAVGTRPPFLSSQQFRWLNPDTQTPIEGNQLSTSRLSTSSRSGNARPAPPRSTDQRSYRPRLGAGAGSTKIEQILEERAALAFPAVLLTRVRANVVPIAIVPVRRWCGLLALIAVGGLCRPLEHLVQLAAVQPDAPALRAVVDLDALSLGHAKFASVNGTVHQSLSRFQAPECVQLLSFRSRGGLTLEPRTIAEETSSLVF